MDLGSSISLGRIRGIAVRVHWSWMLILGFLTWSLAKELFQPANPAWSPVQSWLAAFAVSLLFFASILLHELAHSLVAQRKGMVVPSITLFVFGGVSGMAEEMHNARDEFQIAIAGPATSWLLAGVFGVAAYVLGGNGFGAGIGYLALSNFVMGLFNLLPGFPLDGGRVLRAVVWSRTGDITSATHVATRAGKTIAFVLIALGVIDTLAFGLGSGLWYVLIGLFLQSAASTAEADSRVEHALQGVLVRDVMQPPPEPVAPGTTIQQLVDSRMLMTGERAFLVSARAGDAVVGLISATDIARIPREEWASTGVEAVMTPSDRVITVASAAPVLDALRLLTAGSFHELPVVDSGTLMGVLTAADLLRQIEVRSRFQSTTAAKHRASA